MGLISKIIQNRAFYVLPALPAHFSSLKQPKVLCRFPFFHVMVTVSNTYPPWIAFHNFPEHLNLTTFCKDSIMSSPVAGFLPLRYRFDCTHNLQKLTSSIQSLSIFRAAVIPIVTEWIAHNTTTAWLIFSCKFITSCWQISIQYTLILGLWYPVIDKYSTD